MPNAATFFYPDLRRNTLFHRLDMADDANHLATGVERIEGGQRNFQRVAIERAKTFVKKKRINRSLVTHQIRQCQGQRQADQKAFTA